MSSLALILAVALQVTGVWSHLTPQALHDLANASAPQKTSAAQPPAAVLPIRTGTDALSMSNDASVLAVDRATGQPLFEQNADRQRPIASVTKLISILVILSEHKTTDTVTVGQLPEYDISAETIGLRKGERYRLGDLVAAALIPSANDAADALAIYDAGSVGAFTDKMNEKMKTWGITGTHFSNPSGLSDDNNFASARALVKIGLLAMANPVIKQDVARPQLAFSSLEGRTFSLMGTNKLLADGGFYGIKTGYTQASGQCFVGITPVSGHDVITVVLGTDDRFGDTQSLVNWIGSNWQWF